VNGVQKLDQRNDEITIEQKDYSDADMQENANPPPHVEHADSFDSNLTTPPPPGFIDSIPLSFGQKVCLRSTHFNIS
jgi:hypothetical protein